MSEADERGQRWPPWAAPPAGEVPVPLSERLVLLDSADAAVMLTEFECYSTGLAFWSEVRIRWPFPSGIADSADLALREHHKRSEAMGSLELLLRLPQGDPLSTSDAQGSSRAARIRRPSGPVLVSADSAGGDETSTWANWWLWPMPRAGSIEFTLRWPAIMRGQTASASVDSTKFHAASRDVIRLWD